MLPIFTRWAWAGYEAKSIWHNRVQRIMHAWPQIEIASVYKGLRLAAILSMLPHDFPVLKRKLSSYDIFTGRCNNISPVHLIASQKAEYHSMNVIITAKKNSSLLLDACKYYDHEKIGELLGYPACCRKFYQNICVEQKNVDTIWHAASENMKKVQADMVEEQSVVEIKSHPYTNMLIHKMNLKVSPHLPCSFHCDDTIAFAKEFVDLGKICGYTDEMEWLLEILSWPMEWSALNGIAEIKTPAFKMITNSDIIPVKHIIRRRNHKI